MDILLGGSTENQIKINSKMLNRHGIISGATGTGKTATLKVIAEGLSDMGVPVFITDIKGDLSGFLNAGVMNDKVTGRINSIGINNYSNVGYPVRFFDVMQKKGHPVRTTVSEMGPLLLTQLLSLNETQEGVLRIAFSYADDNGLLLLDTKDLKAVLNHIGDNAKELRADYGNISSATVGAIMRAILALEQDGGELLLSEPAFDIKDFFAIDNDGRGFINILNASELYLRPRLYSSFLLWFISELYESLEECGDLEKPKMVFFFDEAHIIFDTASKPLLEKLEQIIKLIRSKGVGIFFCTQNPLDIPEGILAQLGNRICHSMRAFTPKEQKAVKAISEGFVQNPAFDCNETLLSLQTGEALVSVLLESGIPSMVQKAIIAPPKSSFSVAEDELVNRVISNSPLAYKYSNAIDRESAYELIMARVRLKEEQDKESLREKEAIKAQKMMEKEEKRAVKSSGRGRQQKSVGEQVGRAMMTSFSRSVGTSIARGLLGSMKKLF